jgi:chromosome segregation ATPase
MTPIGYFFARAALPLGFLRRNKRMTDAANEAQLLREAESHLGARIWERVDQIEELSIEYWNLRRLAETRSGLLRKLGESQQRLAEAQQQQQLTGPQRPIAGPQDRLLNQRDALHAQLKELATRRDELIASARSVRRTYEGLKMKHEVLTEEAAPAADLAQLKTRLAELKHQFTELKDERLRIGSEISSRETKLEALDQQLKERGKVHRAEASEASHLVGETNKQIASLRAEIGLVESKMQALQCEIGRHVSRQPKGNPAYAPVIREFKGLISIMDALRRSIAFNQRLAGRE